MSKRKSLGSGAFKVCQNVPAPLLTTEEVATILRVHRRTVQRLAKYRRLSNVRGLGRHLKFRPEAVQQFMGDMELNSASRAGLKFPVSLSPLEIPTALATGFDEKWLTREQVGQRLQFTSEQVYRLTRRSCRNPLPFYKVGRYQRFKLSEIETWMKSNKKA